MADYSPACPTCGNKVKDVSNNLPALDALLSAGNGKRYPQSWYEDLRDAGAGSSVEHPTLGVIKVHYMTDMEENSYGDYVDDGDGHIVFQFDSVGDFLKKDFTYNSYGTVAWGDHPPIKVSQKAKTVTVYEYE